MIDLIPRIKVSNLSKYYAADYGFGWASIFRRYRLKAGKEVPALNNISLSIPEGKIFIVMGLSGSGKSTLLRCLNRLVEPSSGSIVINEIDITTLQGKQLRELRNTTIGMVFQHFALLPHISVLDNVAFGLRISGLPIKDRRQRALEIINLVGLAGWEGRKPSELSGGMRQRVGIARALVMDTPIILMDEPFSALDPLIRAEMQQELLRLQRSLNKTIVFVTHDANEAATLGDEIAILRNGELVQQGTPDEILSSPINTYVKDFFKGVNRLESFIARDVIDKSVLTVVWSESSLNKVADYISLLPIIALNSENQVVGLVREERLLACSESKLRIDRSIVCVPVEMPLSTLMAHIPGWHDSVVAVIENGKYLGAVTANSIIEKISQRKTEPRQVKKTMVSSPV